MTPGERGILDQIRRFGRLRQIEYADHARDQMKARNVSRADVQRALVSAGRIWPADEPGRWEVEGWDLDHTALRVVVAIERGALVVTVYRPGARRPARS
jgi:hypothetical protein